MCVCIHAEEVAGLQCMKRILGKVQEMREQRSSLEKQLRDLIQQDDITSTLVTAERADIKVCDHSEPRSPGPAKLTAIFIPSSAFSRSSSRSTNS